MSCPICEKRASKRFCPAKGEKICAVCCGQEREITIDCPQSCFHLIVAHRYESGHRRPVAAQDVPHPDVQFSVEFVYERWAIVSGLAGAILAFQSQNRELNDVELIAAIEALAETFRTLETGIIYERPPEASIPRRLYAELAALLQAWRKEEAERSALPSLKDSDIFRLLVFLLRLGKQEGNGRPRSRAFLDFLRAKFPLPAGIDAQETSRIIVP
ncbi:MAG: hypothetical protein ACRD4S_09640 [Candidatus Acidiferrales bacterium]